jgi:hypothetical protein
MRFGDRWKSQLQLRRNLSVLDAGNDDGRAAHRGWSAPSLDQLFEGYSSG